MAKPLKETFFARILRLLKGILFYNTVYWQRASDGLNPPRLTRDERKLIRPVRDLHKIRPRANPRARLESLSSSTPDVSVPLIGEASLTPAASLMASPPPEPEPESVAETMLYGRGSSRKRRKRRRVKMRSQSFFKRWFG